MSDRGGPAWLVCPVCKNLMVQKRADSEPECDRCRQSINRMPAEESETNH